MADVIHLEGCAGSPGGGPYVILRLTVEGERVIATDFETNGCPAAQVAACGLATFAKGRTLLQLSKLEPLDLLLLIGSLPEGMGFYADMAVDSMKIAIGGA